MAVFDDAVQAPLGLTNEEHAVGEVAPLLMPFPRCPDDAPRLPFRVHLEDPISPGDQVQHAVHLGAQGLAGDEVSVTGAAESPSFQGP